MVVAARALQFMLPSVPCSAPQAFLAVDNSRIFRYVVKQSSTPPRLQIERTEILQVRTSWLIMIYYHASLSRGCTVITTIGIATTRRRLLLLLSVLLLACNRLVDRITVRDTALSIRLIHHLAGIVAFRR